MRKDTGLHQNSSNLFGFHHFHVGLSTRLINKNQEITSKEDIAFIHSLHFLQKLNLNNTFSKFK